MALLWRRRTRPVRRARRRGAFVFRRIVRIAAVFVVLGALCCGVWYLTRLPALTVSDVTIEGGETLPQDDIRQTIARELSGTYFFLIPKSFTLFYPHDRIIDAVENVPRVKAVTEDTPTPTTLALSIEEYEPAALWCPPASVSTLQADDAQASSTEPADASASRAAPAEGAAGGEDAVPEESHCVFLSDDGYAFAKAPPLRGGAFLRHIFDDREPKEGEQPLSKDDMARIDTFVESLASELDMRVRFVEHTKDGDEVYMLAGGGRLLVSPSEPEKTTFDNLVSILHADEFSDIAATGFDYIDLRFGDRVFVNRTGGDASDTPDDSLDDPLLQ
jgi:hypothetical protein